MWHGGDLVAAGGGGNGAVVSVGVVVLVEAHCAFHQ